MGEAKRKRTSNLVVAPRIEVMLVTDNKTGPERYEPLLVKSALARQTLRRLVLRAAAMSIPGGTAVTTKSDLLRSCIL